MSFLYLKRGVGCPPSSCRATETLKKETLLIDIKGGKKHFVVKFN